MPLNKIYDKTQKDLEIYLKGFNKEMDEILRMAKVSAIVNLKGLSEADILSYELRWRQILKEAGYYSLIDNLIDNYFNTQFKPVIEAFAAGGIKTAFTKSDAVKIQAIKAMEKTLFLRLADDVGLTLKRQLYGYAISNTSLIVMATGMSETLAANSLTRYANTYARTAVQNFQQEVINIRAADIEGVWVYVGIQDGKNRDFCAELLSENRTYTDSEKIQLEEAPERAFNCRHRFYKMSDKDAKEAGYDNENN